MGPLAANSISIIKMNQHPRGSYVACPLFLPYGYGWLRDGTFTAYAMNRAGEHESAEAFYRWVNNVLAGKRDKVRNIIGKKKRGEFIDRNEFLGTRFQLDGREDHSEWGHFQLDGYGAWLWGLTEHCKMSGSKDLLVDCRDSIELTVEYLLAFWQHANYDCWEEYPDHLAASTLACIYGGLQAMGAMLDRSEWKREAENIQAFILHHCVRNGRFIKSIRYNSGMGTFEPAYEGVDASLLWLSVPFGVVDARHDIMLATTREISLVLQNADGGLRRYAHDSYYGGGAWILLTAWYGWISYEQGDRNEAERCLSWIEAQADKLGRLPEQVPDLSSSSDVYQDWVHRSGDPALPLLWSQAMYLVLYDSLQQG